MTSPDNDSNNSLNSPNSASGSLNAHSTKLVGPRTLLDLREYNWIEWSRKLTLLALQQGFAPWLDGSLPCPDATVAPGDYFIWKRNDGALRYFIQSHVSPADVHLIELLPTAHLMFDTLRSKHEQQGTFAQINLLLKALQIQLTREKPIRDSIAEMRTYYRRIVAMGKPKEDDIFAVILLNSMDKHLGPLQQTVNSMSSSSPNFNSEMIVSYLLATDNLVRHRVELGYPANPYTLSSSLAPSSAFAAISSRPHPLRPVCSNCKRGNHTTEFCISPGGKMAGRSIGEARAAYRATLSLQQNRRDSQNFRPLRPQAAHVASSTTLSPSHSNSTDYSHTSPPADIFINGLRYVPVPSHHTWNAPRPAHG